MTAYGILTIGLYVLASWRLGVGVAERDAALPRPALGAAIPFGLLAIFAHLSLHASAWRQAGGVDLGFFAALSLVGLGMAMLSTGFAWTRRFDALGRVVYPLAGLCGLIYGVTGVRPAAALDWPVQLHALLALLAYATLAVSALLALMLWLQDTALRRRQLGSPLLRLLPPLTELEALLFRSIGAGFALLSAALLTGALFVDDLLAQHLAHKTVLSILSWLVFGALLLGRRLYGWRGRRAVRLTLGAMLLLLLAFFGSKLVLELILERGRA